MNTLRVEKKGVIKDASTLWLRRFKLKILGCPAPINIDRLTSFRADSKGVHWNRLQGSERLD